MWGELSVWIDSKSHSPNLTMRPLGDVWHSHLDQGRLSLIRQPYKGRPKNSLISSLINNCLRDQCRSPWKDVLVRYRLELQPKSQQLILPNTGPQFLLEHKGDQTDSMMPSHALDGDFQVQQDITAFWRKEWWEGRTTQLVFMTEILKKPEVLTTILVNWKHTLSVRHPKLLLSSELEKN